MKYFIGNINFTLNSQKTIQNDSHSTINSRRRMRRTVQQTTCCKVQETGYDNNEKGKL